MEKVAKLERILKVPLEDLHNTYKYPGNDRISKVTNFMAPEVSDKDAILKNKVVEALKNVYDPEIPINIWDLGLVYEVNVSDGVVHIKMTLTSPMCPIAYVIVQQVTDAVSRIEGVKDVKVDLVFDPPWDPTKMTEEGRKLFKKIYGYDIVEEFSKQSG